MYSMYVRLKGINSRYENLIVSHCIAIACFEFMYGHERVAERL